MFDNCNENPCHDKGIFDIPTNIFIQKGDKGDPGEQGLPGEPGPVGTNDFATLQGNPNPTTLDQRQGSNNCVYWYQWSHDNYGDGNSHHEMGQVATNYGLYEFNKKSGLAPSNTGQWVDNFSLIRDCKGVVGRGEGIEVINTGVDLRNGCCFIGYGTIVENCRIGIGVFTNANNRIRLYNVTSRFNDDYDYYVEYGNIEANNCKVNNTTSAKYKLELFGGTITVKTDINLF